MPPMCNYSFHETLVYIIYTDVFTESQYKLYFSLVVMNKKH